MLVEFLKCNFPDINQEISVLCGAGVSMNSGLPSAYNYLDYILKGIGFPGDEINMLKEYEIPFESFMELFLDYNSKYEELLGLFSEKDIRPNTNHYFIANLAKMGVVKNIYTTNFDTLIESALIDLGFILNSDFYVYSSENEFLKYKDNGKINVFKIHGSAHDFDTVRTTLSKIASKELNSQRSRVIDNMLNDENSKKLLIFGYSCSDIFDISPQISQSLDCKKEIVLFEHIPEGFSIEDIKLKNEKNPFKNFNGYRVFYNTNESIKELWEYYKAENYSLIKTESTIWIDRYLEKFVSELYSDDKLFLKGLILLKVSNMEESNYCFSKVLEITDDIDMRHRSLHNIGRNLRRMMNYEKSLEFYDSSLKAKIISYSIKNDIPDMIDGISQAFENTIDMNKTIEFLEKIDVAKFMGDYYDLLSTIIERNSILIHLGKYDEGLVWFDKLLKIASKGKRDRYLGSINNEIGMLYSQQNKYEEAIKYLNDSIFIKEDLGDLIGVSNSLSILGSIYIEMKHCYEAIDTFNKCIEIREKLGEPIAVIEVLIKLLKALYEVNNYDGLINCANFYLPNYEKYFGPSEQKETYKLLAKAYSNFNDFDNSLFYYKKVEVLLESIKGIMEEVELNQLRIEIAEILRLENKNDEALLYYGKCVPNLLRMNNLQAVCGAYRSIGLIMDVQGKHDEALTCFKNSIKVGEGMKRQLSFSYAQIGNHYFIRKEYQLSIVYTLKAYEIISQNGNDADLYKIKMQLKTIKDEIGIAKYLELCNENGFFLN